jgi:hypothetical protein
VLSRIGQVQTPSLASVVGHSLPERLRSASIGLLCLVAVIGLGLIALVSNQSLPDFLTGVPILGPPHEHVGNAQVVSRPHAASAASIASEGTHVHPVAGTAQAASPAGHGHAAAPASTLHQQQPAAVSQGSPSPGAKPVPKHPSADQPTAAPPTAAPPAASPPVEDSGDEFSPGNGNGKAKGHEKSQVRSTAPASVQPVTPTPPPAVSEESNEDGDSGGEGGPGNGHGHAYGHYK